MRFRVVLAACVLAASEAVAPTRPPVEAAQKSITIQQGVTKLGIASGYYREICHALKRGDKRRYDFTSTVPLDFNIHYHSEAAVIDLAVGNNVRRKEGIMVAGADGEETYCWMWVNLQLHPAELTFRIWGDAP